LRIPTLFDAHEKSSEDAHQNTSAGQYEGQQDARQSVELIGESRGHKCGTQHHGSDDGTHIRLKQIGAHSCHVTHIVTHIVRDGGRIQGMVFRNPGLDLTNQVGAYVGRLGVDAATYPGKECDG